MNRFYGKIPLTIVLIMIMGLMLIQKSFSAQNKSSRESCGKTGALCRRIVILPLDGRNQTYDYIGRIVKIHGYEPIMPPRAIMGNINDYDQSFKKNWDCWYWLNNNLDSRCAILILSADSLVYGGLLESRHSPMTILQALNQVNLLKIIRKKYPHIKILVFSSIPRREAENRDRNFLVNARLLEFVKSGVIDFLSISGDDVTDISRQVSEIAIMKKIIAENKLEAKVLISDVDRIRLGIDESAMVLFTRYINSTKKKKPCVYIEYRDITSARMKIDRYSATPVMSVALDMVEAVGAEVVYQPSLADLVLAVNHPSSGRSMEDFTAKIKELRTDKPVALGDISARTERAVFFKKIWRAGLFPGLAGYATWGMGTNALGTTLCEGFARLSCKDRQSYTEHTSFLYERLLTDYIYLCNIHLQLAEQTGIPAYSLSVMTPEQEREAVEKTVKALEQNLNELGIELIPKKGNGNEKSAESDNIMSDNSFRFLVKLPANPYATKAEIKAGPVVFPFHRLFEIDIPTKAELKITGKPGV
ncbi:MAG: DUF4127 family protein [Firmicutes bacterium]|nr:DUF4127 family protein [Bacillota bacterium]